MSIRESTAAGASASSASSSSELDDKAIGPVHARFRFLANEETSSRRKKLPAVDEKDRSPSRNCVNNFKKDKVLEKTAKCPQFSKDHSLLISPPASIVYKHDSACTSACKRNIKQVLAIVLLTHETDQQTLIRMLCAISSTDRLFVVLLVAPALFWCT
ncbi:hypothetical protein PsorP6_000713 [Peronosclerospora sorghi]|uniref:Uncharacterized protein n=1 Tax=Peronosclerospora sorghi TaxID=230839 RepID=A0ACC0WTC8_9STRA|nr:hypothetical protein PsorP6_000713 [Peronosclerospora sorghi]